MATYEQHIYWQQNSILLYYVDSVLNKLNGWHEYRACAVLVEYNEEEQIETLSTDIKRKTVCR